MKLSIISLLLMALVNGAFGKIRGVSRRNLQDEVTEGKNSGADCSALSAATSQLFAAAMTACATIPDNSE